MNDDILLTGFLDDALELQEAEGLQLRLKQEPQLMERLEVLARARDDLGDAFASLERQAPVERMQARLAPLLANRLPSPSRRWAMMGASAAAVFALGAVVGRFALPAKRETWRDAVANYMSLYADAPFNQMPPEALERAYAALSDKIGLKFDAASLAIDGLSPRLALRLSYEGAPLAEFGYQDGDSAIALCIIKNGQAEEAPHASRTGRLARVAWAHGGVGFLAIGVTGEDRIAAFAKAARERFG